ncbi:hypothetical protein HMF8227_00735 [Saliniradius amylolyticus]|uniref:Glycosyltransferase 2-like domain-containing protein n=1 Tax=Saliniradius amylolyticus TaxID=2183582 RepID=A0A2S2E0Q6_9ALTE|nr:glycosyltransferase [Saliniradius amylolyticus]AWL11231.1 hypothetical protein HMF8227_00735 [Saliniradius amylolyticus]
MPLFSVCIPHYGSERLLLEAVKSVAVQTVRDFELIISLDSPVSDAALTHIRELVPDVKITQCPTSGIAQNWNHSVEQATGEYTVLLHSDDKLKLGYLGLMNKLIQQYDVADAWFCGVALIDECGQATWSFADSVKTWIEPAQQEYCLEGDLGLAQILKGCFVYCPTICYRSEVIKEFGFSERWGMVLDLDLYARLLMGGKCIVGTRDVQFEYRRHSQSTTAQLTKDRTRFEEEWMLYQLVTEQAETIAWQKTAAVAKRKLILRLHALFCSAKALAALEVKLSLAYFRQALVK